MCSNRHTQATLGPGAAETFHFIRCYRPSAHLSMTSPMLPSGMSLSTSLPTRIVRRRRWDSSVPPSLRPIFRAYLLAYASVVAPKLVSLVAHRLTKLYRDAQGTGAGRGPQTSFLVSLRRILGDALHPQRFPTFCALLIGGSTWLKVCLRPP